MPELKIYTVKDLREWLENNHPAEGLSERVIAPTRAWAIIHNPYVKDEDAIVSAIFEDGELAAYTASFPDMLDGMRVWWASTLYCYPKFIGKGYGLIAIGSLMEAHEPELTYDRWGAQETVEIFHHFGYQTTYTKRYRLTDKRVDTSSFKGKFAYCVQELKKSLLPWPKASKANYTVQYSTTIDDEAYAFMKAHRNNDLWLRDQEMLNWIMAYPFIKAGTNESECVFGSNAKLYKYNVVKVYVEEQLEAVYVLRLHNDELSLVYLYYAAENQDIASHSIIDSVINMKPKVFVTENMYILNRLREVLYFPKTEEDNISLSLPNMKKNKTEYTLQLGDGDSFA